MTEINIHEIIEEINKNDLSEEKIINNTYPFQLFEKNYRIVMPSQFQLTKAKQYRHKVFTKLVQDGCPIEQKWIKILKETQNIDIEKIDNDIERYKKDLIQVNISKAKTKDNEVKTRAKLDKKISEIEKQFAKLVSEKAEYLAPTANSQAKEEYYRYLTYLCTEKLVDEKTEKYEKYWSSWEDYEKDQSNFSLIALGLLTDMLSF